MAAHRLSQASISPSTVELKSIGVAPPAASSPEPCTGTGFGVSHLLIFALYCRPTLTLFMSQVSDALMSSAHQHVLTGVLPALHVQLRS